MPSYTNAVAGGDGGALTGKACVPSSGTGGGSTNKPGCHGQGIKMKGKRNKPNFCPYKGKPSYASGCIYLHQCDSLQEDNHSLTHIWFLVLEVNLFIVVVLLCLL